MVTSEVIERVNPSHKPQSLEPRMVDRLTKAQLKVAMVYRQTGVFPSLNEAVALGLKVKQYAASREKILRWHQQG